MAVTRLTTNGLTGTKYDIASADNYYMEPIATINGTGSSGIINFTSIPLTYKHLQIRVIALPSAADQLVCRVGNGSIDTGSNYSRHTLNGNGTNAAANGTANYGYFNIYGWRVGGSTTNPMVAIVDILDYANTNKYKTIRILSGMDSNGSGEVALNSGLWMNTASINQIRLYAEDGLGNWSTSSRFSLYGIKG
jgi:hypothetical protein